MNGQRRARRSLEVAEEIARVMASALGHEFTIVTGGAPGADSLAEQCAEEWGMTVKLCLPPHHHRVSEKHPAIPLKRLKLVQPLVERAGRRLGRHPTKNPFVRDLLARNWFIVEDVKAMYAFANFEDDALTRVEGGTGMTVQMCVDRNRDFPHAWTELFVFDESRHKWYELEGEDTFDPEWDEASFTETLGSLAFRECLCAPLLHASSAVVGSRTLGELGRRTLKDQFKRTVKRMERWSATETELRDEVEQLREMFKKLSIKDEDVSTGEKETI